MSNLPETVQDDQPPLLRFVNDAVEDRFQSELQGKACFKDIIKVYVRAHGDTKTEVPFIAKDVRWVNKEIRTEKNGETTITDNWVKESFYPWIEQLDEKLKDHQCTPKFHESCVERFKKFEATGEILVEGTPISGWNQITPAQQKQVMNAQILSVEELAKAPEEALNEIGMGARARVTMGVTTAATHNKDSEVIKAQNDRITEQSNQLSELEKKLADLMDRKEKETPDSDNELESLRKELDEKGVKYHPATGVKKLRNLLESHNAKLEAA